MEVVVASSLLGLGYLLNKDGINKSENTNFRQLDTKQNIPNQKNNTQYQYDAYNSDSYGVAETTQIHKVRKNWKKAKDAVNTNIVPPFFNDAIINDQKTSVQYLQRPKADRSQQQQQNQALAKENTIENFYEPLIQPAYPDGPAFFSQLAGKEMESFTHGNMVPFFRGSNKQSVDPFANQQILENFSGKNTFKIEKAAIEPMFKPTADFTYVYGTPVQSDKLLDRFVTSIYRQSEVPTDPVHVGPGLNQGYTSEPTGGFQQFDIQEFALPRTTDEIRTLDNPKLTYEGRATGAPKSIVTNRGLVGRVEKKLPDKFYIQTPDRYLKTTGAYLKPEWYGEYFAKETARQNSVAYEGVAGPAATHVESLRPAVRETRNVNFSNDWQRNANLEIYGEGDKWDYSKNSYCAKPNERITYEDEYQITNLTTTVKALIAPLLDIFRTTRKEDVLGNPNKVGYMGRQAPAKPRVYDPNDVARTTIKETNVHNNHNGYMGAATKKIKVYDPNDVARTTIKETNVHNNHNGYMGTATKKLKVHDPNDVARTTIKETNVHNNHSGYMGTATKKLKVHDPNDVARTTIKETNIHNNFGGYIGTANKKIKVHDPNDVAKTTIKETNIHNERLGNMKNPVKKTKAYDPNDVAKTTIKETNIHNNHSGYMGTFVKKLKVYDPNDIARTTIKETNIHNNNNGYIASTSLQNGDGYQTANYQAPNTNRQFTSDYEYTGVADGKTMGGPGDGYQTANFQAPNTNRQFTSDYEYEGVSKAYFDKPMDETMWDNMRTNEVKTGVSEGRYPTLSNTKVATGGKDINLECKKIEDDRLNQYAPASTRLYTQTPHLSECTVTTDKDQLPNDSLANRIEAEILDAFRENPYAQPLDSWI